ncbi:MAG: hypothetical protein GEV03_25735 [Streptosporangiales bacterium]|nr:hypothetical protein [Streptosporangiales bacterium]
MAAEHRDESIDAFSVYWDEFARHVEEGGVAAEQAAVAVDAMAQAILGARFAIFDGLRLNYARIQEARSQPWVWEIIVRLILLLIRLLRTHLARIWAALCSVGRAISG